MADPKTVKMALFTSPQLAQLQSLGLLAEQAILSDATAAARAAWVVYAQSGLSTMQQTYIAGIQEPQIERRLATIALVGTMPNALEHGQPSYDMHNTLLGPRVPVVPPGSGQRGKHKKKGGGYYRAIPFRHATPGTVGQAGAAMGSAYSGHAQVSDAGALGKDLYRRASRLRASMQDPLRAGKTLWGGRLPAGLAPRLKPHHHSDIYAGMVRVAKKYQKATQAQYMTFRTISTGSPGWVRKETQGIHLMEKVQAHMQSILPGMVEAFLRGAADGK